MKSNTTSRSPKWLPPVLLGALCIALSAAASWFDLTYNGGKLVYPMDSYAFEVTDIPMIAALFLDAVYAVYLLVLLIGSVLTRRGQTERTNRTRRLSPKWGLLGFLGVLGLAGFWSYGAWGNLTPFCFFVFFGFFGFYFEGKMSDTLMDERYRENAARAQQKANRTGTSIIFLLLITAGHGSAETTAAVLMAGVSLALGLTLFLNDYLLYRYDHDGEMAPDGEEE